MTPECDLVVLVYRPDRIRSPISAENEHRDPYRATAEDEIAASTPRRNGTKVTLVRATVSGSTKDSHASVSSYAPF
ncbi:hypothetical protein [Halalkalicoccus salilacus]|uniref:hypothetical protein n=1 Tax=Halalkalicoccus salilacus TaxID=3117459 RepID=UPI00300F1FF7